MGDNIFNGVLSIGDIQRAIINNIALTAPLKRIVRENPRVLNEEKSAEEVKKLMLDYRMEFLPVVDTITNKILKIYFWDDFFPSRVMAPSSQFELPVIIMAGGLGTRLEPLTKVIPKPLIPIDNKTIIEHIFDKFALHGCSRFFISVTTKLI